MIFSTTKLTFDTDDGRKNYSPSIVVDSSGRKIIFYEKQSVSGLTEYTPTLNPSPPPPVLLYPHVTFTLPFTINVPAGSGNLNGTPVSWSLTAVTATANTFELVYVDLAGVVHITDDFPMTLLKNAIMLAWVNTGASAVVRVNEIEKTGKYVYSRKQVLSGPNWVWDDYEYPISTGEKPVASYDASTNKAYVSYQKDGRSYARVFDLSSSLTWSYLANISIDPGGVISLNNDPTSSYGFTNASGKVGLISVVNAELFGMSGIAMTFTEGDSDPYVHEPFMTDTYSYSSKLVADPVLEFYYKSGPNYILERSITIPLSDNNDPLDRWIKWTDTPGQKYLVLALQFSFLVGVVRTNYESYPLYIQPDRELRDTSDPLNPKSYIYENDYGFSTGSGKVGSVTKTYEYEQLFDLEADSYGFTTGSGSRGVVEKTAEYEQLFGIETDSYGFSNGSGSRGSVTITT